MTPHLSEGLLRWHLNITSDCTVAKIHSAGVQRAQSHKAHLAFVSSLHPFTILLHLIHNIPEQESKKFSSVSLSLLNFWGWQGESTQGHLSASSIPGARQQEASWEQISLARLFPLLGESAEREWGQMHIADKSLQRIPIPSSQGGRRKLQGDCDSQPPWEIAASGNARVGIAAADYRAAIPSHPIPYLNGFGVFLHRIAQRFLTKIGWSHSVKAINIEYCNTDFSVAILF